MYMIHIISNLTEAAMFDYIIYEDQSTSIEILACWKRCKTTAQFKDKIGLKIEFGLSNPLTVALSQ